MKKIFFFTAFIAYLLNTSLQAQEFTYGIVTGVHAGNIEVDGTNLSGGSTLSSFNNKGFPMDIGIYADYQLNDAFGIKTGLFYRRSVHSYEYNPFDFVYRNAELLTDQLVLQPLLKYDVNKTYNKGFYLLAGPRASFVMGTTFSKEAFADENNIYKNTHFGALLGFGFTFSKAMGLELLGDYGFTNMLDSEGWKTTTMGAVAALYFNLDTLLGN